MDTQSTVPKAEEDDEEHTQSIEADIELPCPLGNDYVPGLVGKLDRELLM